MVDGQWFPGQGRTTSSEMTDEIVASISERYIELYEHITESNS